MGTEGYDAKAAWNAEILQMGIAYPAEYVIRIFKGVYPRLAIGSEDIAGKTVCDVSCGDGHNFPVFRDVGLRIHATEITAEIVEKVRQNASVMGIQDVDVRVGANDSIPFDDGSFDFVVSWNACYYMGPTRDFDAYVAEFARVTALGGQLVMSIPKKTCYIYHGSETLSPGLQIIRNDPFGHRNGEVLRMFSDQDDIARAFAPHFGEFVFGSVEDDCFGYDYHWHLVVCRKP